MGFVCSAVVDTGQHGAAQCLGPANLGITRHLRDCRRDQLDGGI